MMEHLTWAEFAKVEMRVGTVLEAEVFKEAKNPAFKLKVDFGEWGIKKTSAQITKRYTPQELVGQQVIAVTNFKEKQIANFMSQCLVLGLIGEEQNVTLLTPGKKVKNGLRVG